MEEMTAVFTEDRLTPFTFDEAAEAMRAALWNELGKEYPSIPCLALALAKTALETGRWQQIHCYNWGNIKAGQAYVGMYTSFKCNEVIGGKTIWFAPEGQLASKDGPLVGPKSPVPPGHVQTRFRAYANKYDGAYQYVEFVASGRYVDAWKELLEGDAEGYVQALYKKGYFTADPAIYGKGVKSLCREFQARLEGKSWPAAKVVDLEWERIKATIRGNMLNYHILSADEKMELTHENVA